jgi:hypothetical protein
VGGTVAMIVLVFGVAVLADAWCSNYFGYFKIINKANGLCLMLDGDHYDENGATIYLDKCSDSAFQYWSIGQMSNDEYVLTPAMFTGKAIMPIRHAISLEGGNIHQWDYSGQQQARWRITPNGDGSMTIRRAAFDWRHLQLGCEVSSTGWTNAVQNSDGGSQARWYFHLALLPKWNVQLPARWQF